MKMLPLLIATVLRTPDTPSVCTKCEEWNRPQAPFQVVAGTYYVGVHGLSSILIDTGKGLILLDAGLPQSAPLIEANIKALGFRIQDVKFIVGTHTHFDHSGGLAALQRDSGAEVAASKRSADALRLGCPVADDPQSKDCDSTGFPAIAKVKEVVDGESLKVGDFALTAHLTPGHTPGSTSWTWKSCEGKSCLDVVYADSLNAVSDDGFRFTGDKTHPDISKSFAQSIAKVAALPCDVLLSAHPDFSDTFEKQAKKQPGQPNPFIDRAACREYAAQSKARFDKRIATEKAQP